MDPFNTPELDSLPCGENHHTHRAWPEFPHQMLLWPVDIKNEAEETRRLQHIASLEQDAESARFDWTERRHLPNASVLWQVFAFKAALLQRALEAAASRSPRPFSR